MCAGERIAVEIEGMNPRPETAGREREQAASGADIEKGLAVEVIDLEHLLERFLGLCDTLVIEHAEKRAPIPAEFEPRAGCHLALVLFGYFLHF